MRNITTKSPTEIAHLPGHANYLVRDGLIEAETAAQAIETAHQQAIPLTSYLVRSGILSGETILACCAKYFKLPIAALRNDSPALQLDPILKPELVCHYRIIPLQRDAHSLQIGIADPSDHATLTAIGFHTGLRIHPVLVSEEMLDSIIRTHYRPQQLHAHIESTLSKISPAEERLPPDDKINPHDEPVSTFVDRLMKEAIEKNVSDIHVEPDAQQCRIRFRRDGLLYEAATVPPYLAARITTRLKIIANLNIAERRLPQDGRIQFSSEPKVDIRINTCPTLFGEKIVLRILNMKQHQLDMDFLGLTEAQKNLFLEKLMQPQGLILVTGPTGSGKTMTLYAALHYLNQIEKNISSVEDPVEIELKGINQVAINPKIGLDFATVLRAFLRQDPDIIMVGEIRDTETATIAMQAAQTGHLVLSTLHTNNAIETITRLQSMGIANYHLISAVSFVIAQRLVRKLCPHCKVLETLSDHALPSLPTASYQPVGCERCCQGYQGRIGVFECLPITECIAQLILTGANAGQLLEQVKKEGWPRLWEMGLEKVRQGLTSLAEVMRVIAR